MDISKADSEKMRRLASEGKAIAKIWREYFPKLSYWDVYFEVYDAGGRSTQGIKRMITTRLNKIANSANRRERNDIAAELNSLVWHLYDNHKTNQRKITAIRTALKA